MMVEGYKIKYKFVDVFNIDVILVLYFAKNQSKDKIRLWHLGYNPLRTGKIRFDKE